MPYKPKRPCSYSGCPNLTNGRYCAEHQKLTDKQYNLYERDKVAQKFYQSNEWKAAKRKHLQHEPLCRECASQGKYTKATMVDHIVPIKKGGAPLLDSNLQSLCWSCHSKKSAEEGSRWGNK